MKKSARSFIFMDLLCRNPYFFSCQVLMNGDKNILKVNIFGTDYPLKVNADVEYVKRVANYVDRKMREVQASKPNRPLHQIAILAALNITDELLKQNEPDKNSIEEFEKRLQNLTRKLELGIKEISEDIIESKQESDNHSRE